jgi:hypothetical protein
MLPAVFPQVEIVKRVSHEGRRLTVRALCAEAGIECRVTGPAVERVIYVRFAQELAAAREPGPTGVVSITVNEVEVLKKAILALGILAYAVFDYTARESLRGLPEARLSLPLGRPCIGRPKSGAERTRKWREKTR